jgi:hypothetical protein
MRATSVITCALLLSGSAWARSLLTGVTFSDGTSTPTLWDIDTASGGTSNPRPLNGPIGQYPVGITFGADANVLYTVMTGGASTGPNRLFRIDAATGAATEIGTNFPRSIFEGDIRYNRADGLIYTIWTTSTTLQFLKIDPAIGMASAVAVPLTGVLFDDMNGLAFHPATGDMYILDQREHRGGPALIYHVDRATGAVLSTLSLDQSGLNSLGGIEFDESGSLYYIKGDTTGERIDRTLYRVDLLTGATTPVGDTGVANFCGIASIPPPATLPLVCVATALSSRRRRR